MENYIKSIEFKKVGKKTTICCITLYNDFEVVGSSSCVDYRNFDKETGEKYALKKAKEKLEEFIGFYISTVQFGFPYDTK